MLDPVGSGDLIVRTVTTDRDTQCFFWPRIFLTPLENLHQRRTLRRAVSVNVTGRWKNNLGMLDSRGRTSVLILLCALCGAQVGQDRKTLVINGQSASEALLQTNGRRYVELETLARIANGSLGFQGNQITLTLPASPVSAGTTVSEAEQPNASRLSQNFAIAGIETIAQMREWASTLAYAIQNGYGVTENWVANYREQAAHSLRLATAAASTDDDRNALQLLTHEFEMVREWSNKLVEAKKSMDTAKYVVSSEALRNEPLSQKIISCGHFLGAMLGSRVYKDDASCQ